MQHLTFPLPLSEKLQRDYSNVICIINFLNREQSETIICYFQHFQTIKKSVSPLVQVKCEIILYYWFSFSTCMFGDTSGHSLITMLSNSANTG